jgi:hypothetical protein
VIRSPTGSERHCLVGHLGLGAGDVETLGDLEQALGGVGRRLRMTSSIRSRSSASISS